MNKRIQCVVLGMLLAFVAAAADEGEGLWQDVPAWVQGTFTGKAEGWLFSTGQEESVWVDMNPKARVSLTVAEGGKLSGELKIGARTLVVSAEGIVPPDPKDIGANGFIDILKFRAPAVSWGEVKATNVAVEVENLSDDYAVRNGGEENLRALLWLRFSLGEDKYEVEAFRKFEEIRVPQAIKNLEGSWVFDGDNEHKWAIAVDEFGSAKLSGKTDDGFEFETESNIIDCGVGLMVNYFGGCGAYFNVPATKDHEGVDTWIGFNPEDRSGNAVDACVAIEDRLTIMNDEECVITLKDDDDKIDFILQPSKSSVDMKIAIPQWIEHPERVMVLVPSEVEFLTPNGTKARIVRGEEDITKYLTDLPKADGEGVIDLTQMKVREEFVKAALDPLKGAKIELNAENSVLTTTATIAGLIYTLNEGATLKEMKAGDAKVGDGQPWTPKITVKGGNSAFYSISVEK